MRARLAHLVYGIALGIATTTASAQQSGDEPGREPTPAPQLSLEITESGPQLPWHMAVRNTGSTPVLLSADPRLLWLEVKVPGKKRLETCRLPKELFPNRTERGTLLWLDPTETAGRDFDPRLYCYAEGGQRQLVPGAQITPHFGWPKKTRTTWKKGKRIQTVVDKPPYVARSANPKEPESAKTRANKDSALKVVKGTTFALGSNYAAWAQARLPSQDQATGPFQLRLTRGSDARAERTATIRLTLQNRSERSRYVYFRRELVSFEVMGPDGLVQCDPEPDYRAPERHSYSYLPAGKTLSVSSRLVELCPRGTFARPGHYLVHARFDAAHDGEEYELDAFVGRVVTHDAVGVRIRTGDKHPLRLHREPE